MANRSVPKDPNSGLSITGAPASSVIEGEMTSAVRVIGLVIAGLVAGAILLGLGRASTSAQPGAAALVSGLFFTEVALAGILILLGSIVEGFGYGLSLGTNWPYTRNILVLMVQEIPRRLIAWWQPWWA